MACGLIEFGSLYLDGKPVYPGTSYKGGKIEIGPTIQNTTVSRAASKRLKWYFTGGRLIASECILKDISWDALNAKSLVYGREITVGAMRFRIRLLRGNPDELGEWMELVNAAGGPVNLAGSRLLTWGQDCEEDDTNWPAAFACIAGPWCGYYTSSEEKGFCWRPVLECLSMDPTLLLGKRVIATSNHNCQCSGILESVSDYDLVLGGSPGAHFPHGKNYKFCKAMGTKIAIDRGKLLFLEEEMKI